MLSVPQGQDIGYTIEMYPQSIADYTFPGGSYWVKAAQGGVDTEAHHRLAGQAVH